MNRQQTPALPFRAVTHAYGSERWFDSLYQATVDDPWGLDWRPSQAIRYRRMLELIRVHVADGPSPLRILDIGCATGKFTSALSALAQAAEIQVTGVDTSELAVRRARQNYPGLTFEYRAASARTSLSAQPLDVITCLEVLYYLGAEDRDRLLEDVRASLHPHGIALFSSRLGAEPYFSPSSLEALIARRLEIVDSGLLLLRPIVLCERGLMKAEALMRAVGLGREKSLIDRTAHMLKRRRVFGALSALGTALGRRAATHVFVLARRPL